MSCLVTSLADFAILRWVNNVGPAHERRDPPPHTASIEAEFAENQIPMFGCQIHEREAYRAVFAFGGLLDNLDPEQVANLPAARLNAKAFASEVIEILKAHAPAKQREEVA